MTPWIRHINPWTVQSSWPGVPPTDDLRTSRAFLRAWEVRSQSIYWHLCFHASSITTILNLLYSFNLILDNLNLNYEFLIFKQYSLVCKQTLATVVLPPFITITLEFAKVLSTFWMNNLEQIKAIWMYNNMEPDYHSFILQCNSEGHASKDYCSNSSSEAGFLNSWDMFEGCCTIRYNLCTSSGGYLCVHSTIIVDLWIWKDGVIQIWIKTKWQINSLDWWTTLSLFYENVCNRLAWYCHSFIINLGVGMTKYTITKNLLIHIWYKNHGYVWMMFILSFQIES